MENNNIQNQPTINPTSDYSNMSEKEQMDLAMKQTGMGPGGLEKMVAKNVAKSMAENTAKSWLRRILGSFIKF